MTQPSTTAAARPTFEDLYAEYHPSLIRYTLSKIRGITEDDAADMVGDVWVRVYQALPEWKDQGTPIGAWLFRMMRNEIIDRIRAFKGRHMIALDPTAHDVIDDASEAEILSVLSSELIEEIIQAMGDTPLGQRQGAIIRMVYVEGLRLTDVAHIYNETLDATKKSHRRILGRVRTFLETGLTRRKRQSRTA